MRKNEPYILWLPSWYPNKLEPYNGDFIQRHAKAASLYKNICVIYIIKDINGDITKGISEESFNYGRLRETIIYYYIPPQKFKLLERIFSFQKYITLSTTAIRRLIKREGIPQLINLYIAYKAGLLAFWASKKFKVPYVISEQWTIYLEEAQPNFKKLPFYVRLLVNKIYAKALDVMVVSDYLGKCLQRTFSISKPILIPNVVDEGVFYFAKKELNDFNRFVHISNLNYQKNPQDILKAFSIIKQKGYKFSLNIIGPEVIELYQLVMELNMTNEIRFYKEMAQSELAKYIQEAEALILFSRYETFGCVIIEANACGVPVIASDIPVLHENIQEAVNGLFASNCDPVDLSKKIISLISNKNFFDRENISRNTLHNYSLEKVGMLFHNWYNKNLK